MNRRCVRQPAPTGRPRGPAAGLTLIELIVAIALLSIMITCFSKIIAESRKLVGASQVTMRANNMAMALDQSLREDLRRACENGFLCIGLKQGQVNIGGNTYVPMLVCSTAGPNASMTDFTLGRKSSNSRTVVYSLCPSGATGALWKAGWILRPEVAGYGVSGTSTDYWNQQDVADLQVWSKDWIHMGVVRQIASVGGNNYFPTSLANPPETPGQIDDTWKYIASNCTNLEIMWTDGSERVDGNNRRMGVNWYGVRMGAAPASIAKDGNWTGRTAKGLVRGQCEYNGNVNDTDDPAGAPPLYHAMWTKDDQGRWPVAVKMSFTITDDAMPREFKGENAAGYAGIKYEVICPIDR